VLGELEHGPWFLMRAWRHANRALLVSGLGFGSGHITPSSTALLSPTSVISPYFGAFGVGVVFSKLNILFHPFHRTDKRGDLLQLEFPVKLHGNNCGILRLKHWYYMILVLLCFLNPKDR
jgi:hypothetical protein